MKLKPKPDRRSAVNRRTNTRNGRRAVDAAEEERQLRASQAIEYLKKHKTK